MEIEDIEVFPTDVKGPHKTGIVSLEKRLRTGTAEDGVREPDEAVPPNHILRRLHELYLVLPSLAEAGVGGGAQQRVKRMASMQVIGHVGIEPEEHGAQQDGNNLNSHISQQQVASPDEGIKPSGSGEEAEIDESCEFGIDAENRRCYCDHKNQRARPLEVAEEGDDKTGQKRDHKTVDEERNQLARDDGVERHECSDDGRCASAYPEVDRGREHGKEHSGQRRQWCGFGPFDIVGRLKQSQSHVPGSFGVEAQPVLEMRNEVVQRVTERIPAMRHLIHGGLVVPKAIPGHIKESCCQKQSEGQHGQRGCGRDDSQQAAQTLTSSEPVTDDQRKEHRSRRHEG
ncbi:MAG: hypothetical protein WAK60_02210 [Sedimentisphaerales bacterium]